MSNASRLLIEVEVKGGKASITQLEGVDAATTGVGKSGKSAAKAAREHDEALGKLGKVASVVSATGIAVVAGATYEAIKSGIAWQKTLTGLETTLGNVGVKHAKAAAGHIGDVTEALSTKGGYNAEEQITGINQFLRESQSQKQALKDNETAMNFARASGQEYAQVQKYVAMALTGSTGRLEKQVGYIPKVTENVKKVTEAEGLRVKKLEESGRVMNAQEAAYWQAQRQKATQLDKVATAEVGIQRLQQKGAGGMAKYAKTTAGTWSDLKAQIDVAFRQFGTKLLPVVTKVFKAITGGLMWIINHKDVAVPIAALATAIWAAATAWKVCVGYTKLMQFWTNLTTKGIKATALASGEGATANEVLTTTTEESTGAMIGFNIATGGLIVATALLVVGVIELVKHFKQVKEVAATVFRAVLGAIKTAWGWVKQNWPLLLPILLRPFGLVIGGFIKFKTQIIGVFREVVDWIEHAFTSVLHFIESIPMRIVRGFERLPGMIGSVLKKIPVVGGVMGAVGSVGHALGLNAGGQVPRVRRFAPGGVVPGYGSGDSVPALLTPGEFIMRKQAVSAIGVGTLERANQLGGGATAAGGGGEYVPIQIINKLDSRVLSESMARYLLRRKRLAPGNFAGAPVSNPSIAGAL